MRKIDYDILKVLFSAMVTPAHIKWDWDAGHAYCYIDHWLINDCECSDSNLQDDWIEYTNDWMFENHGDTPPCKGCGGSCDQE